MIRYHGAMLGLAVGPTQHASVQYRAPAPLHAAPVTCARRVARSKCLAAAGPTIRRWHCAWRKAWSSARASTLPIRPPVIVAGSAKGIFRVPVSALELPRSAGAGARGFEMRSGSPSPDHRDPARLDKDALSRVAPVVLFYLAQSRVRRSSSPQRRRAPPTSHQSSPRCLSLLRLTPDPGPCEEQLASSSS